MKRGAIILLLVLALSLSACTNLLSDENILKDPASAMKACEKMSGDDIKGCYGRISEVQSIANHTIALQACNMMPDDDSKRGCTDNLIRMQVDEESKLDVCKNTGVPDFKRQCLEDLAAKSNDTKKALEICNEIKDDNNFREHCLNVIAGNLKDTDVDSKLIMCDSREGNNRDYCYQEIGTGLFETDTSKAIEVCNKISSSSIKNNCLNYFMSSPELIKANPALSIRICDSMTLKDNCYRNVAGTLSATDPQTAALICKKMSDEIQTSDCFSQVWFQFDSRVQSNYDFSVGLCNSLDLKKDDCFRRMAGVFTSTDPAKAEALCKMISDSTSGGCLNQIR